MKKEKTTPATQEGLMEICGSVVPWSEIEKAWKLYCSRPEPAPTTQGKEGLHTQGEKWEVHSTGSLPSKAEIHPVNDPDGLIIIADVYKYEDAELIVKAVNERKALLDSHGKLLELVEIMEKDFNGLYHQKRLNEEGLQVREKIKTAINNAKNIKS